MQVPQLTEEVLRDLRHRGEATMKKWADPPTEWAADPTWHISYCVENLTRTAALSRLDKEPVDMTRFHEAVPAFKKVFGEAFCYQGYRSPVRGPLLIIQFNHFLTEPFFPRDMPRNPTKTENKETD